MSVGARTTPYLVLDMGVAEANARRMLDLASRAGLSLRPHMKTHKTLPLALTMTGGRKSRIAVSTLAEAELYASDGFDDITCAFHLTPDKISRCEALHLKLHKLNLFVENEVILDELSSRPVPERWRVLVEVDHSYGRTGLPVWHHSTVEFIRKVASSPNVALVGLYMHCGDSYRVDDIPGLVQSAAASLVRLRDTLKDISIDVGTLSLGSTPSCSLLTPGLFSGVDEIHPGNYVFYDAQQMRLGSCGVEDIAVSVRCSVIGHYPRNNTLALDCGWTALSSERPDDERYFATYGYAMVKGHPELKVLGMSQEVGKVTTNDGSQLHFSRYPVGHQLDLVPWHSCATAAMHREYVLLARSAATAHALRPVSGW